MPEYGKIDEHRIENAISNVLAHLDEVKASGAKDTARLAGKLALESTAITMKDAGRVRQDLSDAEGNPASVLGLVGNYDLVQAAQRASEVAGLEGGKYAGDGKAPACAEEVAARAQSCGSGVPGAAVLGAIGALEEERRALPAFAGAIGAVPGLEEIPAKLEAMREGQPGLAAENSKRLSM